MCCSSLRSPGCGGSLSGENGVDVGGVGGERQLRALAASGGDNRVQDVVDLADPLEGLDGIERVEPFVGFVGLVLDPVVHRADLPLTHTKVVSELGAVFSRVRRNWQSRRTAPLPCQSCMRATAHWPALVGRDRIVRGALRRTAVETLREQNLAGLTTHVLDVDQRPARRRRAGRALRADGRIETASSSPMS